MRIIKVINLLNPYNFIRVIKAIYRLSQQSTHTELLNNIVTNESILSFLEVGVYEGANLFKLAKNNPNVRFYGVDPYYTSESEILEPVFGIHKTIYSNDKYSQMLNRLQKLRLNNTELIRKTSINASKDFKDLSLDFIFIDGLHSYENVKEDIDSWLPKVKIGGYLAGHDFSLEWFSVVRAVEDTIGLNNIIVNVPAKIWLFKKPSNVE